MKQILLPPLGVFVVFVTSILISAKAHNQSEIDWSIINKDIDKQLTISGLDNALKKNLGIKQPSVHDLLVRMNLAVRAGQNGQAASAIEAIALSQQKVSDAALSQAADFLIGKQQWELAKLFLEKFPQATPGWACDFIKHWAGEHPDKQKVKEIDQWIVVRSKNELLRTIICNYWFEERLRFRSETKTLAGLLDELSTEIHKKSHDLQTALYYVKTAKEAQLVEKDVAWLKDVFRPQGAYDAYVLGDELHYLPQLSLTFLNRSLTAKFTNQDSVAMEKHMEHLALATKLQKDQFEPMLRNWTKKLMAQNYQAIGQNDKAQKLLIELSKDTKGSFPYHALTQFAGKVQAGLPQKPLEKLVKEAEPENKNDYRYWLGRAHYYTGRKDDAQVCQCYAKALELTKLGAQPEDLKSSIRSMVVGSLVFYWLRTNKATEAMRFVWREFDEHPDPLYRARLINMMRSNDKLGSLAIVPTEVRVWHYLSSKGDWDIQDEQLLSQLIRRTPKSEWNNYWQKAEGMINDNPTRQFTLGWVMTRHHASHRAIPLVMSACSRLKDKAQQRAYFTLFEAYIDVNDWRKAEALWTYVQKQLSCDEKASFVSQVALAAALAGAQKDAMRLWQRKDSFDRTNLKYLRQIANAGLKSALDQYYAQQAKTNPAAHYIQEAQKILNQGK